MTSEKSKDTISEDGKETQRRATKFGGKDRVRFSFFGERRYFFAQNTVPPFIVYFHSSAPHMGVSVSAQNLGYI